MRVLGLGVMFVVGILVGGAFARNEPIAAPAGRLGRFVVSAMQQVVKPATLVEVRVAEAPVPGMVPAAAPTPSAETATAPSSTTEKDTAGGAVIEKRAAKAQPVSEQDEWLAAIERAERVILIYQAGEGKPGGNVGTEKSDEVAGESTKD